MTEYAIPMQQTCPHCGVAPEEEVAEPDANPIWCDEDESLPPRPRGRPKGSRDSYPRRRRKRIPPTPAVRRSLYMEIHELIDIAEHRGYHKAVNRGWKHLDQKVDEAEAALLHKVMEVIEDGR